MIFGVTTSAAIPPLSQENREAYSSHIITGVVTGVSVTTMENAYENIDKIYTVSLAPPT